MPQDGSNNYQYPPGTRGVPDQTIESEAYNTFLDDLVVNDLNIPRPIHRGGTGASTASTAIYNLGGERAGAVVTNYDSHVWMSGSFYSAAGATGAPVPGRAFVGIAYSSDAPADPPANLNVIIEARDQNDTTVPGRVHIREKKAGVWGVWKGEDRLGVQTTPPSTTNSPDGALWWDNDNGVLYVNYNDGNTTQWVQAVALPQIDVSTFVAKAGDTMTGRLTLSDDPLNDLHAVPKRYVDSGVSGIPVPAPLHGRLASVSATQLSFLPFGGNKIKINGAVYDIPATGNGIAGLTNTNCFVNGVAGQALVTANTYNVYAFNNGGVITADFSTTAHSASATAGNEGVEIKTGDDTRTLIGKVYYETTGGLTDAKADRRVINWFNRRQLAATGAPTSPNYTISSTILELNVACRAYFLTWGDDDIIVAMNGSAINSTLGNVNITIPLIDGVHVAATWAAQVHSPGASYNTNVSHSFAYSDAAEGRHYVTNGAATTGGATVTVSSNVSALFRG